MTRIPTSIISYYNTSLLVIAVIGSLVTNSLVTVYQSPVWVLAQCCIITLAFSLEFPFQTSILLGPVSPDTDQPRSIHTQVPASCCPQHRPSPWTLPGFVLDLHMPKSQPPAVLNIGLPPGLFLGSSETDVLSLVLVLSPTPSAQGPNTDLQVWTQCNPNNGPSQTTVTWSLS